MIHKKQILVVEDEQRIQEILQVTLEMAHYEVILASDGLVALKYLESGTVPDLIILDWLMPRMDGAAFLEALRQRGILSTCPILFLTADITVQAQVSQVKIADFVSKPFHIQSLLATIATLLAHQENV